MKDGRGEKEMRYYRSKYEEDQSTAIRCVTEEGEPYGVVSICMAGYGIVPKSENEIVVPKYKFSAEEYQRLKEDLFKREIKPVKVGYGLGVLVELREDWKDICVEEL